MTEDTYLLSIDQGTTSSRAILFDQNGAVSQVAQYEFAQHFPEPGWVEHDAEDIWHTVLTSCREVIAEQKNIAAIGITNQRETTIIWDRKTGEPIARAIVWQDRRTASTCDVLKEQGLEELVQQKTGLLLDPYFSGTKVAWLLDHVDGARERAEKGELAFGTVDCFLLWRLTKGKVHATDITNASRTLLYNIHEKKWDTELLELLNVPASILPEVKASADDFGMTDPELFGKAIPIGSMIGDQQAAAVGQGCTQPGMIKSTYGTGCFVLVNTGEEAIASKNRLLTTVAYQVGNQVHYALEGSIFIAGAVVQWLRDKMHFVEHAKDTTDLVQQCEDTGGVYFVPAFTGLGAPYWDPHARGGIFGLTRDTSIPHITRAALESVCYQAYDLLHAMQEDGTEISELRVDGGMAANDWLMQQLSDIVDLPVTRPTVLETTALGAAYLAGLQVGVYDSLEAIASKWQKDRSFSPQMDGARREGMIAGWGEAVKKVL